MKFYHSPEWGFDNKYREKKNISTSVLKRLGLPYCRTILTKYGGLDNAFECNSFYLVIVENELLNKRKGYFGVSEKQELIKQMYNDAINPYDSEYCLIEQLVPCDGCFTGTAMSSGQGKLIIELRYDTIDNRILTSGGDTNKKNTSRIIYDENALICCENFAALRAMYRVVNDVLLYFKGYYEFSFAALSGKNGIYFTYYSEKNDYLNILEIDSFLLAQMDLICKCSFLHLCSQGYFLL